MNVLVVGGAGYIGSHCVRQALAARLGLCPEMRETRSYRTLCEQSAHLRTCEKRKQEDKIFMRVWNLTWNDYGILMYFFVILIVFFIFFKLYYYPNNLSFSLKL